VEKTARRRKIDIDLSVLKSPDFLNGSSTMIMSKRGNCSIAIQNIKTREDEDDCVQVMVATPTETTVFSKGDVDMEGRSISMLLCMGSPLQNSWNS